MALASRNGRLDDGRGQVLGRGGAVR